MESLRDINQSNIDVTKLVGAFTELRLAVLLMSNRLSSLEATVNEQEQRHEAAGDVISLPSSYPMDGFTFTQANKERSNVNYVNIERVLNDKITYDR